MTIARLAATDVGRYSRSPTAFGISGLSRCLRRKRRTARSPIASLGKIANRSTPHLSALPS
jgi:hypothetical protein